MRYRSLLSTATLVVVASISLVSSSAAASARCTVTNVRDGVDYSTLQDAVDAVTTLSGDALQVKGRCGGSTTITGKDVVIRGKGNPHRAMLDAGDATEPTLQLSDASVVVSDLTITGGSVGIATSYPSSLTVTRSIITHNGEGIVGYALLTISDSTVADNDGEGVYSNNTFQITNSTISGNGGLGIVAYLENLTLTNSVVRENTGGGVEVVLGHSAGGSTIANSVIRDNSSSFHGAGIFNSGTVSITNSVIRGNVSAGLGGGIYNWPGIPDAGYSPGELTLTDTTITRNTATSGGGIYTETPITLIGSRNVLCPNTPNDPPVPCS